MDEEIRNTDSINSTSSFHLLYSNRCIIEGREEKHKLNKTLLHPSIHFIQTAVLGKKKEEEKHKFNKTISFIRRSLNRPLQSTQTAVDSRLFVFNSSLLVAILKFTTQLSFRTLPRIRTHLAAAESISLPRQPFCEPVLAWLLNLNLSNLSLLVRVQSSSLTRSKNLTYVARWVPLTLKAQTSHPQGMPIKTVKLVRRSSVHEALLSSFSANGINVRSVERLKNMLRTVIWARSHLC